MKDKELRELLVELHDEIQRTKAVDEKGGELLRDLELDIASLLERSGEKPIELYPSNIFNFESAISHFEVSHPSLTALISKVLESLSNAGL